MIIFQVILAILLVIAIAFLWALTSLVSAMIKEFEAMRESFTELEESVDDLLIGFNEPALPISSPDKGG